MSEKSSSPLSSLSHSKRCARRLIFSAICLSGCLALFFLNHISLEVEAASARVNMHQVSRQTNQYFLNEFCDLESKTLRSAKKLRQNPDTHSLFLTPKNTLSSVRVLPQKQQIPSSISFGFGSSSAQQQQTAPIYKQLNCSIIVVAPKSHGLLVTVNSIGLPKNLTKLGIILNHDSTHAQHVHLEGETTSAHYLLTQPSSSKIAINLQSFQPIDWSHVSFDILFTVYKKANSTGCPNKKWFDCGDNICVPSSLVCDNNRNCPNGNDEMIFYRCYSPLFWSIAASTALALMLVVVIISIILVVKRRRGLNKQHSFSNNVLASEGDLMHDNNSSKLDLTQESAARSSSYLASNLYLGGFENPVWTNGTLTKKQQQVALTSGEAIGGISEETINKNKT